MPRRTPAPSTDRITLDAKPPTDDSLGTGSAEPRPAPPSGEGAQPRRGLTQFLRHYLLALQFFTRIPVTGRLATWVGFSPAMLRASAAHFPGVGWLVGAFTAAVLYGLMLLLPAQPAAPWVAAIASTIFGVLLTGAFHEDGLTDLSDGLGGSLDRERALDIMKDSRIGTYGAIALVLALLAKVALVALLVQVDLMLATLALFAAHVTSRLVPLFIIRTLPHVGDTPTSKSKPLAERISNAGVCAGVVWWGLAMGMVVWAMPGAPWAGAVLGAVLGLAYMWRLLQRRLQGFTGDGLGATQQVCEVAFHLALILALPWSALSTSA
jgi:adenosylcobinamide-GDP ribazoletransferase